MIEQVAPPLVEKSNFVMGVHKASRACANCSLWAPNNIHPASGYYTGQTCLERIDQGITYKTDAKYSCHHFRRVKEPPIFLPEKNN
ncbi:MAG: hypothetical protein HQL70_04200 [Magnetococcales bacterium]|nr:hypothetical protein [Magnetococcales bacterium]